MMLTIHNLLNIHYILLRLDKEKFDHKSINKNNELSQINKWIVKTVKFLSIVTGIFLLFNEYTLEKMKNSKFNI